MKSFNIILETNNMLNKSTDNKEKNIFIESNINSPYLSEHWNEIKNNLTKLNEEIKSNITITIIIYNNLEEIPPIFIPSDMLSYSGRNNISINILSNNDFLKEKEENSFFFDKTFNSPIKK